MNASDLVHDKTSLIEHLESGCTPQSRWRIGIEHEKLVCRQADLCPAPFDGPNGIMRMLEDLQARGWQAEGEGRALTGLHRGKEKVSLEPAGQLEHATAPVADIHSAAGELRRHLKEVVEAAEKLDLALLGIGFEPLYPAQINNWIPNERFLIMRGYMPRVGGHGLDMMQRTASVQISLDFADERGMVRKFRAALVLQPLTIALCANSPFAESRSTDYLSYRTRVWQDTDADRCGLPEMVFDEGFCFERYVDWALDVPLYSVIRQGHHRDTAGQSFREFLAGRLPALPGEKPCLDDWIRHLTTLSPEVRLKQVLELRGADSGPPERVLALAAFWLGLLYDEAGLDAATDLIRSWDRRERQRLYRDAPKMGLQARVKGQPLAAIARELLEAARAGLSRRQRLRADGSDETCYLAPLETIVSNGRTPAHSLLEGIDNPPAAIRRHCLLSA